MKICASDMVEICWKFQRTILINKQREIFARDAAPHY